MTIDSTPRRKYQPSGKNIRLKLGATVKDFVVEQGRKTGLPPEGVVSALLAKCIEQNITLLPN